MSPLAVEAGDALRPHPAGMARYVIELVRALHADGAPWPVEAWYPRRRVLRCPWRIPGVPHRWYGRGSPAARPRLFHATVCRFPDWKSPVEIATVHDLYALRRGHGLAADEVARRTAYIRRADRVICVSETTREHLHEVVDYPRERTVAIPLAVHPRFRPAADESRRALKRSLDLPGEFLLFVGKARPNKNLPRLIEAHAASRVGVPLLIAGPQPRELFRQLHGLVTRLATDVRFLGYVGDAELPTLLSCAAALCMPSTFEGFGLPVLEAMACGTAVLTSAGVATEETAGGHAVLADPLSVDSLSDGLRRVLEQDASEVEAAATYACGFTWERVSRETLAVYRQALAERSA